MQLGGISWDTFTRTGNALGIPSVDQLHSPAAWLPKIGRFASQQAGFYVKGVRLSNFTVMKLPETQHRWRLVVQPLIWSVVTNRFGTVRGHISGDTNHAPWGCCREILDCCWWPMFKPPGLVTHTPSMFWLKINVRWLESMEICAAKPFHKWLAWCYLVANYPRLVSGLVHPSFLSGLTRSLSHVHHWGELTHEPTIRDPIDPPDLESPRCYGFGALSFALLSHTMTTVLADAATGIKWKKTFGWEI